MVEMSQLPGASTTACGWVGPVVGGEDLNGVSQHTMQRPNFIICSNVKTNKKSTFLRRNALYWYKLCCDRFNMLGENLSEDMMCSNPILYK